MRHHDEDILSAGRVAPQSGLYRAIQAGHRHDHLIVVLQGEELPPCRTCGTAITFQFVQAVEHVTADWDFAGPLTIAA